MNKTKHTSEINKKNFLELLDIKNNRILTSTDELGEEEYSNLFDQGLEFMVAGRLDEAIEYFDHAIRLNPFNLRAYHQKGKCLVLMNKDDEGFQCFEKAYNVKNLETTLKQVQEEPERKDNLNQNDIDNSKFNNDSKLTDEELDDILNERLRANLGKDIKNFIRPKNERMGSRLKSLLNPKIAPLDNNSPQSKYNKYQIQLNEDIQIDKKNYRDISNITHIQSDLEPFNLALNRYKNSATDPEIFPQDGGLQVIEKNFTEQLLEFQRSEIDHALNHLIDQHGGYFYYNVEPQYLFTISMTLLKIAMEDYHMDGIVVSADKPARQIHRILNKYHRSKFQPYYIDCNIGSYNCGNMDSTLQDEQSRSEVEGINNKITFLKDNFSFLELQDAIEISIQKVAEQYEGEDHFIFFDNIAAFQDYTSEREIKKFFSQFGKKIRELNMYGFFMIPKGSITFSFFDSIRNIPSGIFDRMGF